jgi:hypothetical protein
MTFKLMRIEIPVEGNKVDIDGIQYQLNRHQHCNKVSACEESEYANEKHKRAHYQKIIERNTGV